MSTWLIVSWEGEPLGEVEADNQADAATRAEGLWAAEPRPLHVWSKKGLEVVARRRDRRFRRSRRAIAHHEAGHAVLARHFGLDVTRVEIGPKANESGGRFDPESDSLGRTVFGNDRPCRVGLAEWSERKLLAVMGGPMAEYRSRGSEDWDVLNRRRLKGSDAASARSLLAVAGHDACECFPQPETGASTIRHHYRHCLPALFEHNRRRAASAVVEEWPRIEAVAAELERRLRLDGAALDAIRPGP